MTDALTLNLGLRYENHSPWVEVQNRQVNFAPISGQIQFAGQPCIYSNCRALYNSYNARPGLSAAYRPGLESVLPRPKNRAARSLRDLLLSGGYRQ